MTESEDALDNLLRAANPVAEDRLPLPSESPGAQLLYEKITGTPYAGGPSAHRVRRRRWVGPGIAALLALAGGGVEAAHALATHYTTHLAVSCFATPSLTGHALAVSAESSGPVATCSQAWAGGKIGTGPVPLLVACLTPQGVAAVFPSALGADVCGQLGLPALPAGASNLTTAPSTVATSVNANALPPEVRDAVINELSTTCITASQAELYVKQLFARSNVAWQVSVPTAFPADHPCASPGFDESSHQVVLTGIPSPAPPST
jgi:hypothetical protein